MEAKVIKTAEEYKEALDAIEKLMDSDPEPGTEAANKLELLTLVVRDYESKRFPISLPDPIEAIRFRMEQQGLSQRDLVPYIGSRSKVSEVLSKKRPLTLSMIRALHEGLGIPANALIPKSDPTIINEDVGIDWNRFPLREMIKRGWVTADPADVPTRAQTLMNQFLSPLGDLGAVVTLYRKSANIRSARPLDKYALLAWTVRVLTRAIQASSRAAHTPATVDANFMQEVAKLSWSDEGPRLAKEFLEKHGILVVIEPHLPRTYLDGASMLMVKRKTPVIGMSLRYDRIDNFWFCLMHELAHVSRHLTKAEEPFFDDLDADNPGDPREIEADQLARESLIPHKVWETSPAKLVRSPQAAERVAQALRIHPAIVAGRIRYERRNFRILNQLVGRGRVRRLFPEISWDSV